MKESCYEDDSSTADRITIEVNNFDDCSNDLSNSWDSVTTTAPPDPYNVSVVQKPRLVKFKVSFKIGLVF